MRDELIRLDRVSYSYRAEDGEAAPLGAPDALRDVSLSVGRGEYVAVIGHNGSGKSTLAKMMNLILTPTGGSVTVDGVTVTARAKRLYVQNGPDPDIPEGYEEVPAETLLAFRRKVGMVFQNPDNQLVATLVEEDVAFGPENVGVPAQDLQSRVDEALRAVGMEAYAHHAPHKLSGGQKQRIAIAGVLAMCPACMVFDESTAMLDPRGRREILATIRRLNREEGIAVILITHHMNEAAEADRIVVLNDGEIMTEGTPAEIFASQTVLEQWGLECPPSVTLTDELVRAGIPVAGRPLTPDECADAIIAAFRARKGGCQ